MAQQGVPSLMSFAGSGVRSQAMTSNHVEKEQQCVLHWFRGWSPFQKQDFLKFLLDRAVPQNVDTLFQAMCSLNVHDDRAPSIFQCQLKLTGEWFNDWTDKERNDLVIGLSTIDAEFTRTFNQEAARIGQTDNLILKQN